MTDTIKIIFNFQGKKYPVFFKTKNLTKETYNGKWTVRNAIQVAGRNIVTELFGDLNKEGKPLSRNMGTTLYDTGGNPAFLPYKAKIATYYEVVRFDNQGNDSEEFEKVKKWYERGWKKKIIAYMSEWDYGGETIDAARYNENIYLTPTDYREKDTLVQTNRNGYNLCHAESGIYEAFYITKEITEEI